jgi:hypothetical protein
MQKVMVCSAFDLRAHIEQSLRIDPKSKPRVYTQVHEFGEIASLNYWLELVFSAWIATLGLVLDSPAVVIGVMPRSFLCSPIRGRLQQDDLGDGAIRSCGTKRAYVRNCAALCRQKVHNAIMVIG